MEKILDREKIGMPHPEDVRDPHRQASALSDIILGGQDGLVNVLGVILGVAAATSDPYIVLVAGLAATFAESVSMGAVAYTSTVADSDFYESEREKEYRHIRQMPVLEREEVRALYYEKGFRDELLENTVDTITANPDIWVAVMMAEEHRLTPVDPTEEAIRYVVDVIVESVEALYKLEKQLAK